MALGSIQEWMHEPTNRRKLMLATVLTLGFAGVEAATGWWSGSLALLSDAGHTVTDSAALLIAAIAAQGTARAALRHRTRDPPARDRRAGLAGSVRVETAKTLSKQLTVQSPAPGGNRCKLFTFPLVPVALFRSRFHANSVAAKVSVKSCAPTSSHCAITCWFFVGRCRRRFNWISGSQLMPAEAFPPWFAGNSQALPL